MDYFEDLGPGGRVDNRRVTCAQKFQHFLKQRWVKGRIGFESVEQATPDEIAKAKTLFCDDHSLYLMNYQKSGTAGMMNGFWCQEFCGQCQLDGLRKSNELCTKYTHLHEYYQVAF